MDLYMYLLPIFGFKEHLRAVVHTCNRKESNEYMGKFYFYVYSKQF